MRVAVLQLAARWEAREGALAAADALLSGRATELAVLPETALTGYVSPRGDFDLTRFAEPLDGPTVAALSGLAAKHRTWLVGPLVEKGGEGRDPALYNTTLVFDAAGGLVARYRKRHPWYPETWATPGAESHPVLSIAGRSVTLATCFDLHFLRAEGRAALEAADLLVFPSAWVEDGEDTRIPLLVGLAADFDLAVAAANWGAGAGPAGSRVRLPGQGASCVLARGGRLLARAGHGEERIDAGL